MAAAAAVPSKTAYVEGLSEYTTEEQIHALFSISGYIEAIHMGIYPDTRTPAGFCFIEFEDAESADACALYQCGARLDDEVLDVRLDPEGFTPGRQLCPRRRDDAQGSAVGGTPARRGLPPPKSHNLLRMRMAPRGVALLPNDDGSASIERSSGDCVAVLTPADAQAYRDNPHLQQAFINDRRLERTGRALQAEELSIARGWKPWSAYQRTKDMVKTLPENKPRGGLLTLIEFLTRHAGGANTVVFACRGGVGISDVIPTVCFPELKFVLYGECSTEVSEGGNVETHPERFTDADAERWKGEEGVLFVCAYPSPRTDKASANNLWKDMQDQRRWALTMRPQAALLQFRLPYTPPPGESDYLDGDILLPPWNRTSVNITRLVVTDFDAVRTYDHGDYEGFMFYHNRYTRQTHFDMPCDTDALLAHGLDHGWDSAAELLILTRYVREHSQSATSDGDAIKALDLSAKLSGIDFSDEAGAAS